MSSIDLNDIRTTLHPGSATIEFPPGFEFHSAQWHPSPGEKPLGTGMGDSTTTFIITLRIVGDGSPRFTTFHLRVPYTTITWQVRAAVEG